MLTSKQRAQLRAQSNPLETTLMIGKEGGSPRASSPPPRPSWPPASSSKAAY